MRRTLMILWMAVGFWWVSAVVAVEVGTARVNVVQELGQPVSAIGRGDSEVLSYKDGVRIKLKNGLVVEMIGLKPTEVVPEGETVKSKPAEEEAVVVPAEPALTKAQAAELEKMEKEMAAADARARAQMEKSIVDMEAEHDRPPPGPPPFDLVAFLIGVGLKFIMTLAALKLACKYWNSEVEWSGIFIVSAVDVVVRVVIAFIGFKLLHMTSLFYADEAVATVVMVLVLRHVSINQRMELAVQVVFTTKTFTIIVGSFLLTVALRLLF